MVDITGSYNPDAKAHEGFEPLPAGDYNAVIIEGKIEDISKNNNYGRCLVFTWKVQGGDFDGRLIWQRISLWAENMNKNDQVIQIANSQMAALRKATGVLMPKDTDEFLQIPCVLRIKVKPPKDGYDAQNEISSIKPLVQNGNGQATTQGAQKTTPWR